MIFILILGGITYLKGTLGPIVHLGGLCKVNAPSTENASSSIKSGITIFTQRGCILSNFNVEC